MELLFYPKLQIDDTTLMKVLRNNVRIYQSIGKSIKRYDNYLDNDIAILHNKQTLKLKQLPKSESPRCILKLITNLIRKNNEPKNYIAKPKVTRTIIVVASGTNYRQVCRFPASSSSLEKNILQSQVQREVGGPPADLLNCYSGQKE